MKIRLTKKVNSDATVTVVVPCYNYGHFLPELISSVLSQQRVKTKVIIVDDCSPDGSAEIAARLAAEDSRVSVIAHAKNMGHIATYNDGLAQVDSEFCVLLSADDFLAHGALARAVDLMLCNPNVGMVYGYPCEFDEGQERRRRTFAGPLSWTVWSGKEWASLACLRGRNFILSPEVVMRTKALREVGEYNSELPHSGDLEFWLRTAKNWEIGRVNGATQAYYRVHGANMHLTVFATMTVDLRERLQAFRTMEDSSPKQFRNAKRALAREAGILVSQAIARGTDVTAAESLLEFAESHAGPFRKFVLDNKRQALRRAMTGTRPKKMQRSVEQFRTQLDRLRWRLWALTGVS